jgi:hypothetical protein
MHCRACRGNGITFSECPTCKPRDDQFGRASAGQAGEPACKARRRIRYRIASEVSYPDLIACTASNPMTRAAATKARLLLGERCRSPIEHVAQPNAQNFHAGI